MIHPSGGLTRFLRLKFFGRDRLGPLLKFHLVYQRRNRSKCLIYVLYVTSLLRDSVVILLRPVSGVDEIGSESVFGSGEGPSVFPPDSTPYLTSVARCDQILPKPFCFLSSCTVLFNNEGNRNNYILESNQIRLSLPLALLQTPPLRFEGSIPSTLV